MKRFTQQKLYGAPNTPNFKQKPSNKLTQYHSELRVKNLSASGAAKAQAQADFVQMMATAIVEILYLNKAGQRDVSELNAMKAQIDSVVKEKGGVLLVRYTIRHPDGVNNRRPEYVGMLVAGGGASKADAEASLSAESGEAVTCEDFAGRAFCMPREKWEQIKAPKGLCTTENPFGELKPRKEHSMKAAPAGENFGHLKRIMTKLDTVWKTNPENRNQSILFHRATIEQEYLFLSAKEWAEFRRKYLAW